MKVCVFLGNVQKSIHVKWSVYLRQNAGSESWSAGILVVHLQAKYMYKIHEKRFCNGSYIINLDYLPSVPSVARVGGGGFGNGSETVDIDGKYI